MYIGGSKMAGILRELFVEVTNHCEQECVHCSSCGSCSDYAEINMMNLEKLVEEAIPLGLESFTISGGEPLLYPDLFNLIDYLKDRQLDVSLYSCGVIQDEDSLYKSIPARVFRQLKEKGIKKIIFSLHGSNKEEQYKISKVQTSFSCIMESLDSAHAAGLDVEMHVVPMQLNYTGLERIIEIAAEKGIRKISFLRLVPQGRCSRDLLLSDEQQRCLAKKYQMWKKKYKNINIRFGTPFNCLTFSGKKCAAGKDKLLISATGEYFPCEAFKYLRGQRPSIYDTALKDVWNNDSLLNQLRTMCIQDIETCNMCDLRNACHGGCAGQRLHLNGDLLKGPDPCCIQ